MELVLTGGCRFHCHFHCRYRRRFHCRRLRLEVVALVVALAQGVVALVVALGQGVVALELVAEEA